MNTIEFFNGKDYCSLSAKLLTKHKSLTESILTNSSFSSHSKHYLLTLLDNTEDEDIKNLNVSITKKVIAEKLNQSVDEYFFKIRKYYDGCGLKKHIMPSYQIFSDIIYEDTVGQTLKTKDDALRLKFKIPENIFENNAILRNLILTSGSMNEEERQYWFNLSEAMTEKQIEKLYCILLRERETLDDIDAIYNGINLSSPKISIRSSLQLAKDLVKEGLNEEALSIVQKVSPIELKNGFRILIFILEKTQREDLIYKKYRTISESFNKYEYFNAQEAYAIWLLKNGFLDGHGILQQCAISAMQVNDYESFISCSKSNASFLDNHFAYKSLEYVISTVPKEYWDDNRNVKSDILGSMGWNLIMARVLFI